MAKSFLTLTAICFSLIVATIGDWWWWWWLVKARWRKGAADEPIVQLLSSWSVWCRWLRQQEGQEKYAVGEISPVRCRCGWARNWIREFRWRRCTFWLCLPGSPAKVNPLDGSENFFIAAYTPINMYWTFGVGTLSWPRHMNRTSQAIGNYISQASWVHWVSWKKLDKKNSSVWPQRHFENLLRPI
jgi:hypothetical protein